MNRRSLPLCAAALAFALTGTARAEPPTSNGDVHDELHPVTEVSFLAGNAVTEVPRPFTRGVETTKVALQAGVEWQPSGRSALQFGGALYLSVPMFDPLDTDRFVVAALARATIRRNDGWFAKLALGPVPRCDLCRGLLQDPSLLARIGIGRGFVSVDAEVQVIAFDFAREIRPLGTDVRVYAGLSANGFPSSGIALGGYTVLALAGALIVASLPKSS